MSEPRPIEIDHEQEIPGTLPVLPLKDTVVYPDIMVPLTIGQERSLKLMDDVMAGDRMLTLVASRDEEIETPGPEDLYDVGTVGLAHKMVKLPDGTMRVLVQGIRRVHIDRYAQETPYLTADVTAMEDEAPTGKEVDALRSGLHQSVQQGRRSRTVPSRRAARSHGQHRRTGPPHLLHPQHHATEGRRQAAAARGERRREAHAHAHHHPDSRARRARAGFQDPERHPQRDRQGAARVLPPPAAAGNPAGARRDQ